MRILRSHAALAAVERHEDFQLNLAHHLLHRLERLSADSVWAHRASGLRGSLLRCVDQIEADQGNQSTVTQETWNQLGDLITRGFSILEKAAREISAGEIHSE
jgi:hypothetical protein